MEQSNISKKELIKLVVTRVLLVVICLFLFFFLSAGTLDYWQAWVYMAILLIPMIFVMRYFLIHNPEFLERRMRLGETVPTQKRIIRFSFIFFLLAFILPGLDRRWGWSKVPIFVVIIADLIVVLSYYWIVRVFKENIYASRVIEVTREQKVISSGPYAAIRHPMYTGVAIMYSVSPIALGSWWALIPGLMIIPVLVVRLLNEEEVLSRELPGYDQYKRKVKYRLLPGIW
jgi:protein-S-isoprenylcysteine O-methyltransferase Ste14